jgi:hypothetical protein
LAVLLAEGSGGVGQAVLVAQFAYAWRDLCVSVAGQVGVEVVLDLVAEVAAEYVEERAALDVR